MRTTPAVSPAVWIPALLLAVTLALFLRQGGERGTTAALERRSPEEATPRPPAEAAEGSARPVATASPGPGTAATAPQPEPPLPQPAVVEPAQPEPVDVEPARPEPPPVAPIPSAAPEWVELSSLDLEQRVARFEADEFMRRCGEIVAEATIRLGSVWTTGSRDRPLLILGADRAVAPDRRWVGALRDAVRDLEDRGILGRPARDQPVVLVLESGTGAAVREDDLLPPSLLLGPSLRWQQVRGRTWTFGRQAEPRILARVLLHAVLEEEWRREGLAVPLWWTVGLVESSLGVRSGATWPPSRCLQIEAAGDLGPLPSPILALWDSAECARFVRGAGHWVERLWTGGDPHERAVAEEWWRALRAAPAPPALAFFLERLGLSGPEALDR